MTLIVKSFVVEFCVIAFAVGWIAGNIVGYFRAKSIYKAQPGEASKRNG